MVGCYGLAIVCLCCGSGGENGQFCMFEGVATKITCKFAQILQSYVVDCNPGSRRNSGAIGRRTCRIAALVLYSPAQPLSNCARIV